MDAVDPALVDTVERTLRETDRRARHRHARGCAGSGTGCAPSARSSSTTRLGVVAAHDIAVEAEHRLLHAVPRLDVGARARGPAARDGADHHAAVAPPPRLRKRDGGKVWRMAEVLDADSLRAALAGLDGWSGDPAAISRTVEMASFPAAIAVVDRVAAVAEELDHHPDIDIRWRTPDVPLRHPLRRRGDRARRRPGPADRRDRPGGGVRFEISKVLDAIEGRLCTDPALARAVIDLAEVIRYVDLDGGRPATLLRLGIVVDALGRQLEEESVAGLRGRAPGVDLRRRPDLQRADGGAPLGRRRAASRCSHEPGDRVLEVAELLGLPVLSRHRVRRAARPLPVVGQPGRLLAPVPGPAGRRWSPGCGGGRPAGGGRAVADRARSCCPGCGAAPSRECGGVTAPRRLGRAGGQPPPTLRTGAPTCPRHEQRLGDAGPRPRVEVLVGARRRRGPAALRGRRRPAGHGGPRARSAA